MTNMSSANQKAIKELTRVEKALKMLMPRIKKDLSAGGMREVAMEIVQTRGIMLYPPSGAGNRPPTPYYIRGVGMQYATRNTGSSEKFGSSWTTKSEGYTLIASNSASYGGFVSGDRDQAAHMAKIGWKRIIDVVNEKRVKLGKIIGKWVQRSIKKVGL